MPREGHSKKPREVYEARLYKQTVLYGYCFCKGEGGGIMIIQKSVI